MVDDQILGGASNPRNPNNTFPSHEIERRRRDAAAVGAGIEQELRGMNQFTVRAANPKKLKAALNALVEFLFESSITDAQRQEAVNAMAKVLGIPEGQVVSVATGKAGNFLAKQRLAGMLEPGIQKSPLYHPDKLEELLVAVQQPSTGLPDDNPLKTYKMAQGHSGNTPESGASPAR